jgi:hypothetical protein
VYSRINWRIFYPTGTHSARFLTHYWRIFAPFSACISYVDSFNISDLFSHIQTTFNSSELPEGLWITKRFYPHFLYLVFLLDNTVFITSPSVCSHVGLAVSVSGGPQQQLSSGPLPGPPSQRHSAPIVHLSLSGTGYRTFTYVITEVLRTMLGTVVVLRDRCYWYYHHKCFQSTYCN